MLKEIKKILSKNFKQILKFEFVFKIITLIISVPLFLNIFKGIMKITGYTYLTLENVISFLLNPITIIMLLIFLTILGLYSVFDIGTIIILLDASKQDKKIELRDAMKLSFKKSIQIFKPKNLLLLVFVLFLIPFLNLGINSSVITTIKIPEFIMDFIKNNTVLSIVYLVVLIALVILSLNWIYSLHYYFLEDKSFKEAIKSSRKLIHKKHFKDILCIIGVNIAIALSYFLFLILGIILISVFSKLFSAITILKSVTISIILGYILISIVVFEIINTAISYSTLSVLYYNHKEKENENIIHITVEEEKEKKNKITWNILKYSFLVLGIIFLTIFTYGVIKDKFNLNIEYIRQMEITAHRGASVLYPENTMSAFIGAKELGADYVELDVQQTKDGNIIVSHDTNFKRVTGLDLNTYDATMEDIEKLDAGSFKGEEFKGEKIPLFEDVVKWAKENNMKLNIELKPTGHEKDFEKQVVDIITENNFKDSCVVTSQVYEVIENVKKVNSDINTVYVMSFAFGDITSLEYADNFSIEATSITKDIVSKVHKEGKQIYAWTVNTKENINKMIDLNVDNIITDDITLGKELVAKSKSSNLVTEIIEMIDRVFG